MTFYKPDKFKHLNFTCWVNQVLLKNKRRGLRGEEISKAVLEFLSGVCLCVCARVCAVCTWQLKSAMKTNCTTEAAVNGSRAFTLHWPRYPPGSAPVPFREWDPLPYGWRHWTSCTTPGDMCPGDCPILTPPGLWQLCSVCAEARRSPAGCYFWVHTKRKITVRRILWLAYLLLNSRNSFPKERLSALFTQAEMTSWNTY